MNGKVVHVSSLNAVNVGDALVSRVTVAKGP